MWTQSPNQTGLLGGMYLKHSQGNFRIICHLEFTKTWGKISEERWNRSLVKTSVSSSGSSAWPGNGGTMKGQERCSDTWTHSAARTLTLSLVFASIRCHLSTCICTLQRSKYKLCLEGLGLMPTDLETFFGSPVTCVSWTKDLASSSHKRHTMTYFCNQGCCRRWSLLLYKSLRRAIWLVSVPAMAMLLPWITGLFLLYRHKIQKI